jgi:RND superfamily putative drug exporter
VAVHVGGVTATNIDFAHVLTDKLPIFIAIVVLLAFLLLMAVFGSLPVLIFSVLFGLSMDYEVYLISRIQEEWQYSTGATPAKRNHLAVVTGQAKNGPVIAAAASIRILGFGSFMFGGARELAKFSFGLALSVLVDALLIRSLLEGPGHTLPNPVIRGEKTTGDPGKDNVSA